MTNKSKEKPKTRWLKKIGRFRRKEAKEFDDNLTALFVGYTNSFAELFAEDTGRILCYRDIEKRIKNEK
ncbi:hypothetical protein Y032_0261g559 [Ancylostoma ceylanicum]|uniref:Uncharacterized protein n=1 Tax=Ancylostoma ceylanicum TaxID=53326 RepID=A0A016SB34_9BILA|nr:hypothetical protein Y032_0261g559 [Ancylostoma ceylanicum]